MGAGGVPLVTGEPAHQVEQPGERVLDVTAEQVEVGDRGLRGHVVRLVGGGLAGDSLVEPLGTAQQLDLAEAGLGVRVAGRLVQQGAVRRGRRVEVAALDRVVGLVPARVRLGLGLGLGGRVGDLRPGR